MSESEAKNTVDTDVDQMVAEVETGSRNAVGFAGRFILAIAFIWAAFQIYIASSIPFTLTSLTGINVVFNNQEARQIHLAFGLVLAMLAYPLFKSSPQDRVPIYDWILAGLAATSCLYLLFFKEEIRFLSKADMNYGAWTMVCFAFVTVVARRCRHKE